MKNELRTILDKINPSNFYHEEVEKALIALSSKQYVPSTDLYRMFCTGSNSSALKMFNKMIQLNILTKVKGKDAPVCGGWLNEYVWSITEYGKSLINPHS